MNDKWEKEQAATKVRLEELGKNIVAALGEGCVGKVGQGVEIILNEEDGKGYWIRGTSERESHYQIFGEWPRDDENNNYWPDYDDRVHVRVGKKRGFDVLAKEINRRLKPTYDKQFAEQLQLKKEAVEGRSNQKKLIKEIAEKINYGTLHPQEINSGQLRHHKHNISKIEVHPHTNSVSIQTYGMKPEAAKKVLALIVKLNPADCA